MSLLWLLHQIVSSLLLAESVHCPAGLWTVSGGQEPRAASSVAIT